MSTDELAASVPLPTSPDVEPPSYAQFAGPGETIEVLDDKQSSIPTIVVDEPRQSLPEGESMQEMETVLAEPQEVVVHDNLRQSTDTNASVPPTPPSKPDEVEQSPVEVTSPPPTPVAKSVPAPVQVNGRERESRPGTPSLTPISPQTAAHKRSLTMSKGNTVSVVLISSALEIISASKEAKRSAPLKESVHRALEMVKSGQGGDRPREIFEPLRLACETRNEKLMIASLDCISKLISYSFFVDTEEDSHASFQSPPPSPGHPHANGAGPPPTPSLVDLVAHTITACHTEATPEAVSLQIVKALLSLVLSSTILVHHSSLLKAVRTVYNVFLLSTDPVNQMVAQGGLTQMVHHVFTRCHVSTAAERKDGILPQPPGAENFSRRASAASLEVSPVDAVPTAEGDDDEGSPAVTLDTFEGHNPLDALPEVEHGHDLNTNDLFIKDAFLVFRALCKLTMKPLNNESERDLKSHAMRSKLLSLHLVLTVLNSHMALFVDPAAIIFSSSTNEATSFVQAINQYLCLSLSRNAVSPVPQVFEISVEIFWRVLAGMRAKLKKEIEVLLHEIFIPILEMRTATLKQKAVIMGMLQRLCQDPQALVEIYLNYDCDSEAVDNIYEHLMNIISKIATTPMASQPRPNEPASPALQPTSSKSGINVPPSLSTSAMAISGNMDTTTMGLSESQLKRQGLECLAGILRSLVAWGTTSGTGGVRQSSGTVGETNGHNDSQTNLSAQTPNSRRSHDGETTFEKLSTGGSAETLRGATPDYVPDDPSKFESAKQKKTTLLEGVKKFNYKPKRGVQFLLETGFIASKAPRDIAEFLLRTDGLSKAMMGEYMGEGEEENVAVMHAFVDMLEFKGMPFVEALRKFLQAFRLPGESQKIDRYVLKFAERYIAGNPSTPFANADTPYVLAFSTVMLNTDAHSPQVKNRMTPEDFVRQNRGINDGADLPRELLEQIYEDIQKTEIKMKDEAEAAMNSVAPVTPGIAGALANVGRDLQKEAYVMQSNGMANKTEALFKTMMRTQRRGSKSGGDEFFSASHFVHVRAMFEVAWIPFLAGISGPLQDTDDLEVVELCLDGFKNAIKIVCFFDLELERNAFVTTLAKFTFLNNLGEMKTKNMEAIKALLDVAVTEGNNLKGSWHEVLTCVSQLEHMQLISAGADVPKGRSRKGPTEELANESRSTHITVAADMVFSLSHFLSGTAIVDFVQALSDVSWEEIQSSGLSQHPRVFSLQKLVEISYYNMNRIRLEWSNLWVILGEHFNQVCCHNNPHVAFFALDSLRQLAMRFLEKEELPHFKFQKDFLKPFEYTMINNNNPDVRDMVLTCLSQMIQARVQNMRSGWRTMFGVFSAASRVLTERIANSAFEIVTRLNRDHFATVVHHGSFADLTVCITEFCKVSKYQKISLLAIAMLRGVIPVMLDCPECGISTSISQATAPMEDNMIKYWFPVLFGFYDIIMNGEDLEVRRLALDSLFTTLKTYGSTFPQEFWDTVCQELLFPIFAVLKSTQDLTRFNTQEDMSVWLSTTMIQALRDLIDLFTFHFTILERLLDGLLDLLCICICQENDTLARIGTSCLQQFLENNISKLSAKRWEGVTDTFAKLFRTTTPHQLFDESLRVEIDDNSVDYADADSNGSTILPAPLSPSISSELPKPDPQTSLSDRRRIFKQIIVKCVLQLLLIETTNDLLRNDEVYTTIPPDQLLRLMSVLDHSYQFARMFNDDKELRTGLWKVGFMKHLPNLLKQESSSASTLIHILVRMYYDPRAERHKEMTAERLLPLGLGVLTDYSKLRADTQAKNIMAWTPVVAEFLDGFCRFDDKAFSRYLPAIYPLATELLAREVAPEVRLSLKTYFTRVGRVHGITERSP